MSRGTIEFKSLIIACFAASLPTFAILYSVQPIFPILSKTFHLNPLSTSYSLSATTISMAFSVLLIPPLSDRFGRKIIITISLFLASIFTIIFSFMKVWKWMIIMRILTGISLSGVTGIMLTYLSEEINPKELSFVIGLCISGNTIGGFLGRSTTSILSNFFSWNVALLVIGLFSFFSTMLFLFLLPVSNNLNYKKINIKNFFYSFIKKYKDPVLVRLLFISFFLIGGFIIVFNYIVYRLTDFPFLLSQNIIFFLSFIYLVGIYTSPFAGISINKYGRFLVLNTAILMMILGLLMTQFNILFFIFLGLVLFAGGFFAAHSTISSWISSHSNFDSSYALSLHSFFYYLGVSLFGSIGGFFWLFFNWLGISIFVLFLLLLSILFLFNLEKKYVKLI
ncbi:MFS transporter [Buchnera aphidicola]|uniref:MFS transporter n=1 Tax=Buchnera aphidicola TaxID=9 RepID=UPI003463DBDD